MVNLHPDRPGGNCRIGHRGIRNEFRKTIYCVCHTEIIELGNCISATPSVENHDRLEWFVVFGVEIEIGINGVGTENSWPSQITINPAT